MITSTIVIRAATAHMNNARILGVIGVPYYETDRISTEYSG